MAHVRLSVTVVLLIALRANAQHAESSLPSSSRRLLVAPTNTSDTGTCPDSQWRVRLLDQYSMEPSQDGQCHAQNPSRPIVNQMFRSLGRVNPQAVHSDAGFLQFAGLTEPAGRCNSSLSIFMASADMLRCGWPQHLRPYVHTTANAEFKPEKVAYYRAHVQPRLYYFAPVLLAAVLLLAVFLAWRLLRLCCRCCYHWCRITPTRVWLPRATCNK